MNFVFLDTETTGLESCDEVIQLSYVVVKDGKKTPVNKKYKPSCRISYSAMAVHNITEEEVSGLEKLSMDSQELKWLESVNNSDTVVVGHNIDFDLEMLKRHGFECRMQKVDTARCARHLLKDAEQYNLGVLFYQFGLYKEIDELAKELGVDISSIGAHDALYDVMMVMLLARMLTKEAGNFKKLIELTSVPVFVEVLPFGKYKGRKVLEVAKEDRPYLEWMLDKTDDLSEDMRHTLMTALGRLA